MPFYNENGDIVEGVLSPEEAKSLRQEAESVKNELSQVKESLSKLENKDFNFKKLRDLTEAEKEKLTATELELKKRQEALEEEQLSFKEQVIESHKNDALAVLAGEDEDMRKKILHHFNRIKDEAVTKEQISKKMKEAYLLANEGKMDVNPLNLSGGGLPPKAKEKGGASQELKQFAKTLGFSDEDLKKLD